MHTTLTFLDYAVWIAALVLEPAIVAVIVYRRILTRLYFLHAYLLYDWGKSIFLWYILQHRQAEYGTLFWDLRAVLYIFQAALAAQVLCLVITGPITRIIFAFAESVAAAELLIVLSAPVLITEPLLYLDMAIAIVCCLLLLIAVCVQRLDWPYGHIAWGMIGLSGFQIALSMVHMQLRWKYFEIIRRLHPGASTIVLLIWLAAVLRHGREPVRFRLGMNMIRRGG